MNDIDNYLQRQFLLAKVYENADTYVSSDGKKTMRVRDIDPSNIDLVEVKEIQKRDGTVEKIGKVQILLPNGETQILTVNDKGEDMAVDFIGDDENSQNFMLTPRMKKQVFKYAVEANVSVEEVENALFPDSPEEMEKQIAEDTLIPENEEETIKKIKENNPNLQVKEIDREEEERDKGKEEETKEKDAELSEEEKEEEEVNIPENVKDKVDEIKEREGATLKHVLIARNPSSISDQLIDTAGLQDNGGPVYCLAFSSGDISTGNDRIVFVQGERVIDERRYDEDATKVMDEYKTASVVDNAEDKGTKVYYKDMDGHQIVADLVTEPRDLRREDKELLAQNLEELENKQDSIKNVTNLSKAEKIEKMQEINDDRLKLFDKYGLKLPTIRSEIETDMGKRDEQEKNQKLKKK